MDKRTKKKVVVKKSLGPGLHAGVVELESDGSYRVKVVGGGYVRARRDRDVPTSFIDNCMKTGRKVFLHDTEDGPVIAGALYTPSGESPELLEMSADTIRLRAAKELSIRVGSTVLRLEKSGAVRLEGRKLVVDMGSLVRFLSERVELP
jgi:hypothetical protein